uniref:Diphosphomevalonate decarboxylase n=1 Tax=Ixodes ricinus TaxID=34613 RepID=A0A0K8R5E9_IXORI
MERKNVSRQEYKTDLLEIRKRSREFMHMHNTGLPDYSDWHLHICSMNNFPTAAGLASSAAGYACLVKSLGTLFHVKGDLSAIARRGSGSACRSMYGGFVAWLKGLRQDGEDSVAKQIAPENHWPQMRIVLLVVSDVKKDTGSTQGMELSMLTSSLLEHRATKVVPQRMKDITEAIVNRNFHKFAEITMQESNQLHAVCLDTYPPIRYMNLVSWDIVHLVHRYNRYYGTNKLAYSFDAGPNACLFMLEDSLSEVLSIVQHAFPSSLGNSDFFRGAPAVRSKPPVELLEYLNITPQPDAIKFSIVTHVGCGPVSLDDPEEHILDIHGFPADLYPSNWSIY